jgi:hypothetical protein
LDITWFTAHCYLVHSWLRAANLRLIA